MHTSQQKDLQLPVPSGPPLIVPVEAVVPRTGQLIDAYLPDTHSPAPCVLLVHGLYPEQPEVTPRNSQFYADYASHLAQRGIVAGVVDHDLTRGFLYHEALVTVTAAVDELRSLPESDGGTVGMWFFSGGGPLAYPFLADPASWLRCVELTYPVLPGADTPGWPTPDSVIAGMASVPTYLTLVDNEISEYVAGQQAFVDSATKADAPMQVRTVAGAGHGFDALQNEPDTRAAVVTGIEWIVSQLTN